MSIVNLNKARKVRARAKDKARADENAVKFGQTKSQRATLGAEKAKAASKFDDHKRER